MPVVGQSEVSEVERALEELKRELSLFQIAGKALTSGNLGNSLSINYKHLANAAQNFVNAFEAEKNMPKPEPKIKTGTITASDVSKAWEDFDKKIKAATTLTDFINSFEQEKLKRLDMEARLRKLEGK